MHRLLDSQNLKYIRQCVFSMDENRKGIWKMCEVSVVEGGTSANNTGDATANGSGRPCRGLDLPPEKTEEFLAIRKL